MIDQRKDHTNPKRPPERNSPKQLQTNNVPTYNVENTNGTNKGNIYFSLTSRGLFTEEQKGTTGGLRYIDQHILNEGKTRRKNLAIARVDYKKAYYMVLQSWVIN